MQLDMVTLRGMRASTLPESHRERKHNRDPSAADRPMQIRTDSRPRLSSGIFRAWIDEDGRMSLRARAGQRRITSRDSRRVEFPTHGATTSFVECPRSSYR
jgi:hypothetical protein